MAHSGNQPHNHLKAVIFDCDGILVDTEPLHYRAFQMVLAPLGLGHDYKRYLEEFIGFDDRDAFLHAFQQAGRELDSNILESLIEAKANALLRIVKQGVPSFPGVIELVRDLSARGAAMAVASGALRHEVNVFLDYLGLTESFCAIVSADDVSKSKPDPETYLRALDMVKRARGWEALDPSSCIAIEDTPAGIESALAAGLSVIAVTNSFSERELKGADLVVGSLLGLDYICMVRLLEQKKVDL